MWEAVQVPVLILEYIQSQDSKTEGEVAVFFKGAQSKVLTTIKDGSM